MYIPGFSKKKKNCTHTAKIRWFHPTSFFCALPLINAWITESLVGAGSTRRVHPISSLSQLQRSCSGRPAKTCHAVQRRYRAGSGFDSADRSFISRREVTLCPDSTPIYRPPNSNTTETQQVAGEGKSSPLLSLQYSNGYVSPHLLPPRPRTS